MAILGKIVSLPYMLLLSALLNTGDYCYDTCQKCIQVSHDYRRIATEEYASVFLSSFPVDYFTEYDFNHHRGINLIKMDYCVSDAETVNDYFARISRTENSVTLAYLGVRPDLITADELLTIIENWEEKSFRVIISYPSMEYWQNLSEEECLTKLDAYKNFVRTLMMRCSSDEWIKSRLTVCFYNSSEWLTGNPANYESDFNVNPDISHSISMYSDDEHIYCIMPENYEAHLQRFEALVDVYRNSPEHYRNLSDWDVVFFGDSVIAFADTSSIPGAFSGLTDAHTYNCGLGGSCAAMTTEKSLGIPAVVDAFLSENLEILPEDSVIYNGMSDYFENSDKTRKKCFVLNFGLNDYYTGRAISSDDPRDIYTYSGALRTAVEKLQAVYPNAVFVLMAPNFTSYFDNGMEAQSEVGAPLTDYVSAVASLSAELNALTIDNYHQLGINADNHGEYLMDGAHPNEATRYVMAQNIARLLTAQP